MKIQLTTTVLEQSPQHNINGEDECEDCSSITDDQLQLTPPKFVNHPSKDKLFRLIDEREYLLAKQQTIVKQDNSSITRIILNHTKN